MLLPGDSLSIGVNSCNVPAATLVLYRLPVSVSGTDSYARVESGAVAIARKQIVFDGAIPFKAAGQTSFTISSPGRYIIVPTFAGASLRNNSYPVIHVTSLCAGALILDKTCVVVTEPVSGAPVAGADITAPEQQARILIPQSWHNRQKRIPCLKQRLFRKYTSGKRNRQVCLHYVHIFRTSGIRTGAGYQPVHRPRDLSSRRHNTMGLHRIHL